MGPKTGKRPRPWLEPVVFLALSLLPVFPILGVRYFPNSDGPAHVASAAVLNTYDRPEGTLYRRYLEIRSVPPPNMLGHFLLAGLLRVLPSTLADKILSALLMVAFPWSVRWALSAWSPQYRLFSTFALPFGAGWVVHMGFQNFFLSCILFFVALGVWLRERRSPGWAAIAGVAGLFLLVYCSHLVGWVLLVATVGGVSVIQAFRSSRDRTAGGFWADLGRQGAPWALALLPSTALAIHYIATSGDVGSGLGRRLDLRSLFFFLTTLGGPLVSFSHRELFPSVVIAGLTLGLAARSLRETVRRPGEVDVTFLGLAVATTVLYFIAPDGGVGGYFFSRRLILFPMMFLVFWMAQVPVGRRLELLVRTTLIACTLGLTLVRLPSYRAFDRDLAEFLSSEAVLPEKATFLPLMLTDHQDRGGGMATSRYTWPMVSASGYLMADKGRMDLSHYEGLTPGFFLRFRGEVDPSRHLGTSEDFAWNVPPECDLLSYPRKTPGQVDYVLLWGRSVAREKVLSSSSVRSILSQLDTGYRMIYASAPRGLMEVYERRR
jgi:hypothetical protein